MFEYQRHFVRLLWQSKHARCASARVCAESHFGSCVTGGFEWLRPYGTAWIKAKRTTRPAADMSRIRFHRRRLRSRRTPAALGMDARQTSGATLTPVRPTTESTVGGGSPDSVYKMSA
jgi:hypothetical protein